MTEQHIDPATPLDRLDMMLVASGLVESRAEAQRLIKAGHVRVDGETITTLDGQERQLSPEMLIIADAEKPIAVAGVMGGEYSGIMDDTATVEFESAYFEPVQVRRTAKKLGMRTDASARYE